MPTIVVATSLLLEKCPNCNVPFIFDEEWVCGKCGVVGDIVMDSFGGSGATDRAPQSNCVYGGNLGTNIATRQRNADGSSSESYALRGDNGKYKPVTYAIQPWHLLSAVEPDTKLRTLKEQLATDSLRRGVRELELSSGSAPIIAEAKRIRADEEHFLVDSKSKETLSTRDECVFISTSSKNRRIRHFIEQLTCSMKS
ncbi:MAG: TFIIB-type zinc ribbon-containing protein [Nitrososphaerota archaeon]|jgi:ribosomal protein S27E|nr:TFIIB-type zinc ribbon-containing protein [Nitrososphaerota archaeon]